MKERNTSLVVIVLLILSLVGPVHADMRALGPLEQVSSATAPESYVPRTEPVDAAGALAGADVLLIQTALPWDSDADMQVLDSLGYSYDIVDMGSIGDVDLFDYPVVLIVNDQVQAFYDQYAAQVAEFEAYVSAGGILVFFAASDGWAGGTLNADLPGGVGVVTPHYQDYNYIVDADHPVVSAILSDGIPLVDADLYSSACSHGYFQGLLPGTTVVLEEGSGYPTLIEYSLGTGKVLASTQTWEFSYDHSYGDFARKALDDVFLYAFSGGATSTDDIQLDLRVEDAPDSVTVDKSAGSYLDIVARISGGEAYNPSVTVEIPSDLFGAPFTTFVRNLPNNEGSQSVAYDSPGSGQYRITTTLQELPGQFPPTYYKEVVWRFQIPGTVPPQDDVGINGTLAVPGLVITNATDNVTLDVIDWGTSIVVTNRQLLFDRYGEGDNWQEVSLLLEEVYKSLYFWWGEVFYVDHYGVEWNQGTDETAANAVADQIDGMLETWYARLTGNQDGAPLEPTFLVLVGGDEIIPFYRMDDDDYESLPCWLPESLAPCEEDIGPDNTLDPVLNAYEDNYFLSDNIYADVGGGKSDWEKGKLELATGRIVGHSAEAMRRLVINGNLQTSPLTDAVMASRSDGHDLAAIRERLESKNVEIYGEGNPDLTENDAWTSAQWETALEQDFQALAYQGHATYRAWAGTNNWNDAVYTFEIDQGQMGTNHPLIVAHGCNLAIPTDSNEDQWNPEANDNMAYKLVDHGVAGIVGSTGIASTNVDAGDTSYGEQFINEYYEHLIRTGEGSVYSNWFGKAFLETKQNYTPNGWFFQNWDKTDKKTMLEFVYYGLPWSFMETPDNPAAAMAPLHEAQGYALTFGAPQAVDTSYTERFTMTVPSWQFTPVDTFEVLEIPGAEYLYSYGTPVQPYVLTTVNLPPGSVVTDLRLINEHAVDLGFHNIPAADPVSMYRPTTGYTSTMTVSGAYPSTRHTWDVTSYPDRVEVRIGLAPVVFNVDTGSVTLYDESVWQIDYDAAVPVLVYDLDLASEYRGDEPIDARATVENVGDSAKILDAVFKIYDTLGVLVGSQAMSPIFLDPGEILDLPLSWSGLLPHGGYKVTLAVSEGGTRLATTSGSLSVSAGDVRAFNVPVSIRSGEYGSFDLTFANYRSTGVDVTADVFVYDRHGIPVAKLLQRTFWVGPQSQGTTAWSWNPEGLAEGAYRVEAVVRAEGMVFDWPSQQLEVTGTGGSYQVYLPTLMRQATPGCGLTEQVVTGDSLPGADQDVYEFKATAGTTIDVMVDTVSLQTAFDVEACLATASSSITCFAWGDDQVPCTYPPPGYSCPQISAVLPVDGDGKYYLLVESGSGTSNYAGQFGLYRATITADPSSCLLKLVIDNQPGDFLRSLDRLK